MMMGINVAIKMRNMIFQKCTGLVQASVDCLAVATVSGDLGDPPPFSHWHHWHDWLQFFNHHHFPFKKSEHYHLELTAVSAHCDPVVNLAI